MRSTRGDSGAGAVEYAILIAGIAAVIAAVVYLFGSKVLGSYQDSCDKISSTVGSGNCGP